MGAEGRNQETRYGELDWNEEPGRGEGRNPPTFTHLHISCPLWLPSSLRSEAGTSAWEAEGWGEG